MLTVRLESERTVRKLKRLRPKAELPFLKLLPQAAPSSASSSFFVIPFPISSKFGKSSDGQSSRGFPGQVFKQGAFPSALPCSFQRCLLGNLPCMQQSFVLGPRGHDTLEPLRLALSPPTFQHPNSPARTSRLTSSAIYLQRSSAAAILPPASIKASNKLSVSLMFAHLGGMQR